MQKEAWGAALKAVGGKAFKYGLGALSALGMAQGAGDVYHGLRGAIHGDPEGRTRGESFKRALGGAAMIPLNAMLMGGPGATSAILNKVAPALPMKNLLGFAGDMGAFHAAGKLVNPASFEARKMQAQQQQFGQEQQNAF